MLKKPLIFKKKLFCFFLNRDTLDFDRTLLIYMLIKLATR